MITRRSFLQTIYTRQTRIPSPIRLFERYTWILLDEKERYWGETNIEGIGRLLRDMNTCSHVEEIPGRATRHLTGHNKAFNQLDNNSYDVHSGKYELQCWGAKQEPWTDKMGTWNGTRGDKLRAYNWASWETYFLLRRTWRQPVKNTTLDYVYQWVACEDKFWHTLLLLVGEVRWDHLMTKRNRIVPYNNVAHQNPTIAAMSGDVSLTMSRFSWAVRWKF